MKSVLAVVLWVAVGAFGCLSVLALLSIGWMFAILTAAALVLAILLTRGRGVGGLVLGVALPLAWVGWMNRQGPGEVCTSTSTGTQCVEMFNPWPFLAVAALLAALGIVLAIVTVRPAGRSAQARPAASRD